MNQPVEAVEARTDRVAQGTVGIALLAGFVFRVPWLVPGVALVVAVGALGGPRANALHLAFERAIAPRLPSPGGVAVEPRSRGRRCAPRTRWRPRSSWPRRLAFVFGIGLIGWLLAIVEAVIAIIAATTRVHVADRLRRHRR